MLKALYGKKGKSESKPSKTAVKAANVPLIAKKEISKPSGSSKKRELGDLAGSQFRWLNDMLYSTSSSAAFEEFNSDPSLFASYHAGFARQAEKWPTNPVEQCLGFLRRHPQLRVVGDFGCGEARIAAELQDHPPRRPVHSFDLVSNGNPAITACNISAVPLSKETLDVAVFNLSLMGTDWPAFVNEARRCLKDGGILYVSEVVSRLVQGVEAFERGLTGAGFKVLRSVASQGDYFHTFVAKKAVGNRQSRDMDASLLGRCQYKKRYHMLRS